jgi:la-related protein 1
MQMDNQGWVDITMISSFNRIKSLTADLETVKEVASLSTILEICDQNIRLAHGQWRQWVLPDARPSAIGSDGEAPVAYKGEMPFGMPGGDFSSQARDKLVGDIHRDVMRSSPMHLQAASGLTKSVPGGLEAESAASQTTATDEAHATKTNTPATSVSDDPDPHDKLEIIL